MWLTKAKNIILDFLFPIRCAGCKKGKTHCCEACFAQIETMQNRPGLIFAACEFREESVLAQLIHRFKYDSSREISALLASLFEKTHGSCEFLHNSILVPVPLHKRRLNHRGFNQSSVLALEISKKFGHKVCDILQRHRYTRPQVELDQKARLTNLFGAFSIKNPEEKLNPHGRYILVDDVCTTGSTLNECANVLKKHGAKSVFGLVIARTTKTSC